MFEKKITIGKRIGWREIDSQVVSFNCSNQEMTIWNESASYIWKMLDKGCKVDQISSWLTRTYSINKEKAERDIINFLKQATLKGFLHFENENLLYRKKNKENGKYGERVLLAVEMKAIEKLIPFAITFEVTSTCNEKCIHCSIEKSRVSLSFEEIRRILDEISQEHCLFISFSGGEFFTRKDALEIIEYTAKLHFAIDILSNGILISRNIAEYLSHYPVRRVQISMYGATAETHDTITGCSNSFLKTIRGIEYLKNNGIKVEIAFPLTKLNFKERYKVKKLAESLECVLSPSPIITARNNGSKDTFSLRLSNRQMENFFSDYNFSGLYAGRKPFKDHQLYFGFSDLKEAAPCYSGYNSCAITPSGKVLPCNQLIFELGDLREQSFSKIWYNSPKLNYLRSLKIKDIKKCAKCTLLSLCSRCPGLALLEGGDLLGPSPENCRITKIFKKKEVIIHETQEKKEVR